MQKVVDLRKQLLNQDKLQQESQRLLKKLRHQLILTLVKRETHQMITIVSSDVARYNL